MVDQKARPIALLMQGPNGSKPTCADCGREQDDFCTCTRYECMFRRKLNRESVNES